MIIMQSSPIFPILLLVAAILALLVAAFTVVRLYVFLVSVGVQMVMGSPVEYTSGYGGLL